MIISIFVFCVFVSTKAVTVHFSDLKNGSIHLDVEIGSRLYVASTDSSNLLQNCFITDGDGIYTGYTLSKLGVNFDGTMSGYTITTNRLVISASEAYDYTLMTGFIYITTAKQAKDPKFLVYPADVKSIISTDFENATIVVLNYDIDIARTSDYIPLKSSRITGLTSSDYRIYWDEPSATWNNGSLFAQQLVFSNPLEGVYYNNIDPIQMNTDIWYMWIEHGVSFTIEPTWIDPNSIVSSGYTSTGMIMSTYNIEDIKFDLRKDLKYGGESGFRVIHRVENITSFEMGQSFSYSAFPTNSEQFRIVFSIVEQTSDYFSISSAPPHVGQFAVQYFQKQGNLLPTTVSTTNSSSTVILSTSPMATTTTETPTTTNSFTKVSIFSVFTMMIIQKYLR